MFGSYVFNKILLFLAVMLVVSVAQAQSQQGTIINQDVLVYRDADFDAPVIAKLKVGSIYNISTSKSGPFYKIRIKPGVLGWIADTDIKPGRFKLKSPPPKKNKVERKRQKPFFATRYRGGSIHFINYTEDTLGEERSAFTNFYGFNVSGYNTIFDGEIHAEGNLLFATSPPSYYEDFTGRSASGFVVIANFLMQTVLPQTRDTIFFYGFGPLFKYSHFVLEVPTSGGASTYSADDMTIGAVFNLGWGVRLKRWTLRLDADYFWERSKYYGFGLSLGKDF